ncbi:hypothetical protein Trydic_g15695 [Trypoxylus dichotomus]
MRDEWGKRPSLLARLSPTYYTVAAATCRRRCRIVDIVAVRRTFSSLSDNSKTSSVRVIVMHRRDMQPNATEVKTANVERPNREAIK